MTKFGLLILVSPSVHPSVLIPFVKAGVTRKAYLPQFQTFGYFLFFGVGCGQFL